MLHEGKKKFIWLEDDDDATWHGWRGLINARIRKKKTRCVKVNSSELAQKPLGKGVPRETNSTVFNSPYFRYHQEQSSSIYQ